MPSHMLGPLKNLIIRKMKSCKKQDNIINDNHNFNKKVGLPWISCRRYRTDGYSVPPGLCKKKNQKKLHNCRTGSFSACQGAPLRKKNHKINFANDWRDHRHELIYYHPILQNVKFCPDFSYISLISQKMHRAIFLELSIKRLV